MRANPNADPGRALTGGGRIGARPRHRSARQNGQILVIFAGAIITLIGIVAVVVDVSWYWANSLRVQRTADAAALAGAIYLPGNTTNAYSYARIEATKNGYTTGGGVTVTPIQDTLNGGTDPRQLDVTVSAPGPDLLHARLRPEHDPRPPGRPRRSTSSRCRWAARRPTTASAAST